MKWPMALGMTVLGMSSGMAETATTTSIGALDKSAPVRQLLGDGYDIKTGFADTSGGGAYLVLQKATSAYLCHSSPNQVCEKLN